MGPLFKALVFIGIPHESLVSRAALMFVSSVYLYAEQTCVLFCLLARLDGA